MEMIMALRKKFSVLTLAFVSGILFAPASQAETLQEAVKALLETNPDILAVGHNRLARDQEVKQARSGYFPTFDIEAGAGVDYVKKPFDDDLSPQQLRLGVRQNVFAGLSTMNEVERQQARVQSQAYVVQSAAENTALKTANVYLEVLRSEALHNLAKENLTIHERITDQIRLRSSSGVDRKADMDQIQSRLNLAKSNVIISEQNVYDAQTNYLALVGHAPSKLSRPDLAGKQIPPSLPEAEQLALKKHPTLKSANADIDARKSQDEVAKSPFMPIVDLELDQIYEDETNYSFEEREDLRALVRVRYNLFNGWKDKARKDETTQLVDEAREIRNHTHRQVVESIRLSWRAHEAAKDKINYLQQRAQFATATANAYTQQWNIGQRTLLDVLDAEAERIDASRQLLNAEYEALYSQYRILNGTGGLVHALQLEWPKEGLTGEDDSPEPSSAAPQQPSKKS